MALDERLIDPGEIDRVLSFFSNYKPAGHILGRDRDFLCWQFSPERCRGFEQAGLSAVTLRDGDAIVGFLGVIGSRFNLGGEVLDGGWLCNLIVMPDYRPLGGWMRLMKSVHRLPLGTLGVVGFPPDVGQLYRAMGYHVRERISRFIRIVDPAQVEVLVTGNDWSRHVVRQSSSSPSSQLTIEKLTLPGERWDRFWRRFAERGYFGTHRDSLYLNWRYLNHPRLLHVITVAVAPDGEIAGGAVHRLEQVKDRPERIMRLLELMAIDDEGHEALLRAIGTEAEMQGVAFIDHYSTKPPERVLRDNGWFEECDISDTIPALFQPLVAARRSLNVGVRLLGPSSQSALHWKQDLHVVKADGDQDRPS